MNGDLCPLSSFIFAQHPTTKISFPARILCILALAESQPKQQSRIAGAAEVPSLFQGILILDVFEILEDRHARFGMPKLRRVLGGDGKGKQVVAMPSSICCIFNTQHDCYAGKCAIVPGKKSVWQERKTTTIVINSVQHTNNTDFIINTHAFHNASTIRTFIPSHFTVPQPYKTPDEREIIHQEACRSWQGTQASQEVIKKKAKEERAKAKAEKLAKMSGKLPEHTEAMGELDVEGDDRDKNWLDDATILADALIQGIISD